MLTITVPRTDLTTDEVVTVLRDGLGAGYHVLPGMGMGQLPFQGPHQGRPNTIVVGTGDNRRVKAQVTITFAGRANQAADPPQRDHRDPSAQHLRHRPHGPRGAGEQAAPKASRADQAPLPSGWADGNGMTSGASSARWRGWPIGAGGPTVVLGCPGPKG